MLFVQASDDVFHVLRDAGYEITGNVIEAKLAVVEIPRYINDLGFYDIPVIGILRGIMVASALIELKTRLKAITTTRDLLDDINQYLGSDSQEVSVHINTRKFAAEVDYGHLHEPSQQGSPKSGTGIKSQIGKPNG